MKRVEYISLNVSELACQCHGLLACTMARDMRMPLDCYTLLDTETMQSQSVVMLSRVRL